MITITREKEWLTDIIGLVTLHKWLKVQKLEQKWWICWSVLLSFCLEVVLPLESTQRTTRRRVTTWLRTPSATSLWLRTTSNCKSSCRFDRVFRTSGPLSSTPESHQRTCQTSTRYVRLFARVCPSIFSLFSTYHFSLMRVHLVSSRRFVGVGQAGPH